MAHDQASLAGRHLRGVVGEDVDRRHPRLVQVGDDRGVEAVGHRGVAAQDGITDVGSGGGDRQGVVACRQVEGPGDVAEVEVGNGEVAVDIDVHGETGDAVDDADLAARGLCGGGEGHHHGHECGGEADDGLAHWYCSFGE